MIFPIGAISSTSGYSITAYIEALRPLSVNY